MTSVIFTDSPIAPKAGSTATAICRGRLTPATQFIILNSSGTVLASATLKYTKQLSFCLIRPKELLKEIDPGCRTWEGARAKFKKLYPDFKLTETVTVIGFTAHTIAAKHTSLH